MEKMIATIQTMAGSFHDVAAMVFGEFALSDLTVGAILIVALILCACIPVVRRNWRLGSARKALKKLRTIKSAPAQMKYLRKVDAFVYEEMILMALSELGHSTTRNTRYTGDGGIDGRAVIEGHKTYIQAKRYKNHITAQHVSDFAELCRRHGRHGLFVHTGRTGALSRKYGSGPTFDIVSGDRMLKLLSGQGFVPRWC